MKDYAVDIFWNTCIDDLFFSGEPKGGYLILLIRLIFFLKFQIIFRMNDFILY